MPRIEKKRVEKAAENNSLIEQSGDKKKNDDVDVID